nr:hypothetical protein Iba_chr08eCG3470 [Ipomoea batatas]
MKPYHSRISSSHHPHHHSQIYLPCFCHNHSKRYSGFNPACYQSTREAFVNLRVTSDGLFALVISHPEATFRIALVILLYPLASFQPPSHHRQLRQPPTTTPPEKNQSHEEESKVVGHCRCCFAGGSFVASLVRQRRNLLSVPEEASSPELAVNTGEKRGVKMVETSVFGAML